MSTFARVKYFLSTTKTFSKTNSIVKHMITVLTWQLPARYLLIFLILKLLHIILLGIIIPMKQL